MTIATADEPQPPRVVRVDVLVEQADNRRLWDNIITEARVLTDGDMSKVRLSRNSYIVRQIDLFLQGYMHDMPDFTKTRTRRYGGKNPPASFTTDTRRLDVSLPTDIYEKLRFYAYGEGLSMSGAIRSILGIAPDGRSSDETY